MTASEKIALPLPAPAARSQTNGRLGRFSIDSLIEILNKLDRDVEILIKPKSPFQDATTRVMVVTHA